MKILPLLLALTALLVVLPAPAAEKPNILIFLVDDMGLMDTSVPFLTDAEGEPVKHPLNEFYRTPSLETLTGRGMRFEQFYANSVCSPSRVTIMTGQSSARHHTTQWIRPDQNNRGDQGPPEWRWKGITQEDITLSGLLSEAGYRTIYVGKAHFGPIGSFGEFPRNFGFDVDIASGAMGMPGSYYGEDGFGWIRGNRRMAVPGLENYHGQDIYLTEALTLEMQSALRQSVEMEKPFFAVMAYYVVHSPFQPNQRYAHHYEDKDVSPEARAFATMVETMDASVGAILDQLDALGVAENTLVFFLGDNGSDAPMGPPHGIASSAPLRGKKATHYEGGMRIPFIAAWARPRADHPLQQRMPILAGSITREMGTIQDIFPTLLELAEVRHASTIDGESLAPVFRGGMREGEREFLMHFPHQHRSSYFTAYRLGDWKLIYHYTKPPEERFELFNLADDPSESSNLADTRPNQLRRLFEAMNTALKNTGAQFPVTKTDPPNELRPAWP